MDENDNGQNSDELESAPAPVFKLHVNPEAYPHGIGNRSADQPMTEHEKIIFILEALLDAAKKGKLDQIATVAIGRDGIVSLRYSSTRNAFNLIGVLHRLQNDIEASIQTLPAEGEKSK